MTTNDPLDAIREPEDPLDIVEVAFTRAALNRLIAYFNGANIYDGEGRSIKLYAQTNHQGETFLGTTVSWPPPMQKRARLHWWRLR